MMDYKSVNVQFRHPPGYYKDWDNYNDPNVRKKPGRFVVNGLVCENKKCPTRGKYISEPEAFYAHEKQPFWKRILGDNMYICPFCGSDDVEPAEGVDTKAKYDRPLNQYSV